MTGLLFETVSNPIPTGMKTDQLTTADGKIIRYALSPVTDKPVHGTVILLQGRNEYIEKYFETIIDLRQRGFATATFDWRGQGGSSRLFRDTMRGYVRRFDDYIRDFDQFLQEIVLPDCPPPYYILAHSAGGLVALANMPHLTTRIRRIVLAAPLLGLAQQKLSEPTLRRLTRILRLLGLGWLYAANGPRPLEGRPFANNPLTSDIDRYTRNSNILRDHPQLGLGGPTMRWVSTVLNMITRINHEDFIAQATIPTLIVTAGADRVVSNAAIEHYAVKLRNTTLVTIDGARHELLQEADFYREQFWAAFDAFVPGSDEPEQALESNDEYQSPI